ncbi:efflux RND transporter periplasmic adaptor subunit [Halioxenophilus sp. WMMB6]|uniref:efflux RND transporter periplasmic adaptor subunit n=1 Tax=Halioxenophilus sp. WMMB6 TaxID=3073815 RepID=UPI00295EB675|nr:efflux RND transporter periplasmic adaptor subunit [Halioxenophilus sp. WMMB6]
MNPKSLKIILPVAVIAISAFGFYAINAFAKRTIEEVAVDTKPTVNIEMAETEDYQIVITAYGAVEPIEITPLAAQVSGEVVAWNPVFLDGGRIQRGELLFSIEKDAYLAAYLQAEANVNSAEANLIEQQALAEVAADEARRNPGKKYTDLFLRKPQLLSAQAGVKSAQAALKIAKRDLDNCEVYAPFDALVVDRNIGVGQYLTVGSQVAKLYNIERAKIVLPIPGFDSAFMPDEVAGLTAEIEQQHVLGVTRQGVLMHDLGIIDEATRMSHLMVEVDDPYGFDTNLPALKFGSYVKVSFAGKTLANVYRLPQELVNNRTVWVVNEASELEPRQVEVIREEGGYFLIRSGLENSDRIVTTLPEYPQPGMAVKVVKTAEDDQVSSTNSGNDQYVAGGSHVGF